MRGLLESGCAPGAQNEPDQRGKLISKLAIPCGLKIDDGHANLGVASYKQK
jgi:hypothetical protein